MKNEKINHLNPHQHANYRKIIARNFFGGLFWNISLKHRAAIVLSLLLWLFSFYSFIPVVGNLIAEISKEISRYQ